MMAGSVVRMKRSKEISRRSSIALNIADISSASSAGFHAHLPRRLRHFEAVLVGSGHEEDVRPESRWKARDRVGRDRS